jgi:hypothetical protein
MDFQAIQPPAMQQQASQQQSRNAFPLKLYKLLEHAEVLGKTDVVSWTADGIAFKVRL